MIFTNDKILLNTEYTYAEICETLGWNETGGKAKKKQISIIESCYEFEHPIHPRTKKPSKKYIFTKKIKDIEYTDNRCNNGGNKNCGRKSLFDNEQAEYLLLNTFNNYLKKSNIFNNNIYLSNGEIFRNFGFDYYSIMSKIQIHDEDFEDRIFKTVFEQLVYEKVHTCSISKLQKMISFSKGLTKEANNGKRVPCDELLFVYDMLETQYLEENNLKNINEAIRCGKYKSMAKHIQSELYTHSHARKVLKVNKIAFDCDWYNKALSFKGNEKTTEELKKNFRDIVISSIETAIMKRVNREKDYKSITTLKEYGYFDKCINSVLLSYLDNLKKISGSAEIPNENTTEYEDREFDVDIHVYNFYNFNLKDEEIFTKEEIETLPFM